MAKRAKEVKHPLLALAQKAWRIDWFRGLTVSVALMFVFSSVQYSTGFLQTSIINGKAEQIVFTGTVMPLKQTVNFEELPADQKNRDFADVDDKYKVPLVKYNAREIATPFEQRRYVNAKITYSVPYMGNYKLDGKENAGSHAAVDIVALKNTPVYAVANGIVVKAKEIDTGFGPHVAILHPNVPDPERDGGAKANLISSYSHLNKFIVSEGDIVTKGQLIGYIGRRGFATTDHLHFQVDRERTDGWYPSWPFSASEAQAKGWSFVEAVNKGLGRERGLEYTVHPMKWVQGALNGADTYEGNSVEETAGPDRQDGATLKPVADNEELTVEVPKPVENEASESAAINDISDLDLEIEIPEVLVVGQKAKIKLQLKKPNGDLYRYDYRFIRDPLRVDADGARVSYSAGILGGSTFKNGKSSIEFTPKESGRLRFSFKNDVFREQTIVANVLEFKDVKEAEQLKILQSLRTQGVLDGYPDGTFRPENEVSRVEAVKLVVEAMDVPQVGGSVKVAFPDIDVGSWYVDYVDVAVEQGMLDSTGELRPSAQVNMAELLKLVFTAMEIDVDTQITEANVDKNVWYAKYWQEALRIGILDSNVTKEDFGEGMSRIDVANLLFRLLERLN